MWRGSNTSPFFLPFFLARRVEVGSISQKEGYSIADTPMDSIFSVDGACTLSALIKNEGIVTPRTIFQVCFTTAIFDLFSFSQNTRILYIILPIRLLEAQHTLRETQK